MKSILYFLTVFLASKTISKKYLYESDQCKITNYKVNNPKMLSVLNHPKPVSNEKDILQIKYNETTNENTLHPFKGLNKECFYIENSLQSSSKNRQKLEMELVTVLNKSTEYISVDCKDSKNKSSSYFYTAIPYNEKAEKRYEEHKDKMKEPLSILVFVVDSLSRLNFQRTLPDSYKFVNHLKDRWFPMDVHNMVHMYSFENLMAMLSGMTINEIFDQCKFPQYQNFCDHCPTPVWKNFRENGYITAYAEDYGNLANFRYHHKGFINDPTDFYFLKEFESLQPFKGFGNKNVLDIYYGLMIDFAKRFKDKPYFGMFWTSFFTHNGLGDIIPYDKTIKKYLEVLETGGFLNNTVVFFMSDHGMRLFLNRMTPEIAHEFKLPLFYIRLPERLRSDKAIVEALKFNRKQLSSHYNVYMTWKEILEMSVPLPTGKIENSSACPLCKSFFKSTVINSCKDAGIPEVVCACDKEKVLKP